MVLLMTIQHNNSATIYKFLLKKRICYLDLQYQNGSCGRCYKPGPTRRRHIWQKITWKN